VGALENIDSKNTGRVAREQAVFSDFRHRPLSFPSSRVSPQQHQLPQTTTVMIGHQLRRRRILPAISWEDVGRRPSD